MTDQHSSTVTESAPFVPGARVAVYSRWSESVTESFVEKVYKNGNFILRGSSRQWRPWRHGDRWSAMQTGSGYSRERLDLWDEKTDAEIREKVESTKLKVRWRDIQSKVNGLKGPTAALCDAIEAALSQVRP